MGQLSIAIIHYPVLDKRGDIVATSINNLELHDVARSCMTFGVELCYIVTPLSKQKAIADQLLAHWRDGYGRQYNPIRAAALDKIRIVEGLEHVMRSFSSEPVVIGTSSKERHNSIGYGELHRRVRDEQRSFLILFGTGWGLPVEITGRCERMLLPVRGEGDYNHLSLRVAIGIILDRLLGERGENDE